MTPRAVGASGAAHALLAWVLLLWDGSALGQMDQMPRKPKPAPLNGDLPYIRCQTCEIMVAQALGRVKEVLESQASPAEKKKKGAKRRFEHSSSLGSVEGAVEDIVTGLCDAEGKYGGWISDYDVVKRDSVLKLESQVGGDVAGGHCRRECRTIAKACAGVLEDVESDLGDLLISAAKSGRSAGTTAQRVCVKMAGVCKKGKTPAWPEGKVRKNEQFKPKTAKDKQTEELMASLQSMPGMGGQGLSMMTGSDIDLGENKVDPIDELKDEV